MNRVGTVSASVYTPKGEKRELTGIKGVLVVDQIRPATSVDQAKMPEKHGKNRMPEEGLEPTHPLRVVDFESNTTKLQSVSG